MMPITKPVINGDTRRRLCLDVDNLTKVAGIKNQILHLEVPDDNEFLETVFYYLEDHMLKQIEGWTNILQRIHKIKRKIY